MSEPRLDTGLHIYEASSYVEVTCECGNYFEMALPWRPQQCDECGRHWKIELNEVDEDATVDGYEWDGERQWMKKEYLNDDSE